MGGELHVHLLDGASLDRFARLGAGLLRRVEEEGKPRLAIVPLLGEGIFLGRHQRASSALALDRISMPIARRSGGGRAIRAGEGCIGVLLALPEAGALLPAPVGAAKLLNRYVRGLNLGLSLAGAGSGAHYFGRDFVSAEGRQIAVVSQDGLASGAALFEAIVAVDRPLELPKELRGYPEHSDPRADGPLSGALSELWSRAHGFDGIAEAIVEGYRRALECTPIREDGAELPEAALVPEAREDEDGWEESGVADIPIGFAEALVRRPLEPITEVRLRGDFIAPAFVLRELERRLVGSELGFEALGRIVDEAFRAPHAVIHGVRSMRIFPDAILAASGLL